MKVRFWGVRGSVAVSGERYKRTGGNTSCVEVEHEGYRLVLDGGTGLRAMGEELGFTATEVTILFSHYHWDHIQGVPFFMPVFHPDSRITFGGVPSAEGIGVRASLDLQMQPPTFPIPLSALVGAEAFVNLAVGRPYQAGPFQVIPMTQPHPNGVVAYRVEAGGQSLVYATDTEHGLQMGIDPGLVELARDADLLIHDAQYSHAEYSGQLGPARKGWGHSTWDEAVEAARLAGVRRLALFHHDPGRDDDGVADMENAAQRRFAGAFAAREGEEVAL
jgi:phosphoribosyl 1,2-cyclic phosphodiesterase